MEDAMLRMFSPAECLQFQLGADTYITDNTGIMLRSRHPIPGRARLPR
jgi:hypothetical protein